MNNHHKFDLDPAHAEKIRQLEDQLFHLAGTWRSTQPTDTRDAPLYLDIVNHYHEVFKQLLSLGWHWDELDLEAWLPSGLMPDVFYETLSPHYLLHHELMREVRWWYQKFSRPTLAIHIFDRAYGRLLDLGIDPEETLPPQNPRESHVIWYGIPLSPEGYYQRHPERTRTTR